jgi:hypothetical protein
VQVIKNFCCSHDIQAHIDCSHQPWFHVSDTRVLVRVTCCHRTSNMLSPHRQRHICLGGTANQWVLGVPQRKPHSHTICTCLQCTYM